MTLVFKRMRSNINTKYWIKKSVLNIPIFGNWLRRKQLEQQFEVELALLNRQHINTCLQESIIHFSINKSATQYTKHILRQAALENGFTPVHIHDYAFQAEMPFLSGLSKAKMEKYQHIFQPKGYLYSVFGGMVQHIPGFEQYKVILTIRDPRDILVSRYYSIAYSHAMPEGDQQKRRFFLNRRQHTKSISIDEFVCQDKEWQKVLKAFEDYKSQLVDTYSGVYIAKYENMLSDFPVWLDELLKAANLPVSSKLRASIIKQHNAKIPSKEDVYKQTRKGVAGDYKGKLKPETITFLDEKLAPVLKYFDYQISSKSSS